ncbi:STAS domain-containing protein [Mycobacterium sp. SMC-8]|uniref:STAS domain-containing protein n=1 Tax=Mycobacterium sp. SMC-8 TaxID=2857060 RepID=UPI0021B3566D|nr:STAS domain-containing protein [Mycobacterium sp. SMC-8]UXA10396.1 STAS domain-containing protein [Mycobacterium sp. SMC-8]
MSEKEADDKQDGHPFIVRRLPDGTSIVSASGNVDRHKPSLLGRLVADELAREAAQLVLELSRATSVDNAFVVALAGASALAGEADTSFCLIVSPTGPVAEALAAADLIERFEIFATVDEAMLLR